MFVLFTFVILSLLITDSFVDATAPTTYLLIASVSSCDVSSISATLTVNPTPLSGSGASLTCPSGGTGYLTTSASGISIAYSGGSNTFSGTGLSLASVDAYTSNDNIVYDPPTPTNTINQQLDGNSNNQKGGIAFNQNSGPKIKLLCAGPSSCYVIYDFSGAPSSANQFGTCGDSGTKQLTSLSIVPVSGGVGDPQLIGFRGQSYQVHGIDNTIYSLISSPTHNLNARFKFLYNGQLNGKKAANCWSHSGSYMSEIGMQERIANSSRLHQVALLSGSAKDGFQSLTIDGQVINLGQTYEDEYFLVSYNNTHTVMVTTEQFHYIFENSDLFINIQVDVLQPLSQLAANNVHGLLGQTHSKRIYSHNSIKYIEGKVDDYSVQEGSLFGTDSLFNRFK